MAVAVTVFVNNIPPKVHWRWLGRVFQWFGNVVDVYIPKKRNNRGSKFGFVRFETVVEARRAQWNLNGVWLIDHKISVNLARFSSRQNYWRKTLTSKSIASEKEEGKEVTKESSHNQEKRKSYRQALNVVNIVVRREEEEATVSREQVVDGNSGLVAKGSEAGSVSRGVVSLENLHWLETSAIGKIKGDLELEFFAEEIKNVCSNDVLVRKLSGNECIITFDSARDFNNLKQENWRLLENWLEEIAIWSENHHASNRVVWVACYGVPIHAWNIDTFRNIAERWGEFLRMDSVTLDFKAFNKGCMQVITSLQCKIDEFFMLQVGDKEFTVKAIEINHDCEFTGPCCYEELNYALKKVGLDGKELLSDELDNSGEEDNNGGVDEESEPMEIGDPSAVEKCEDEPMNVERQKSMNKGDFYSVEAWKKVQVSGNEKDSDVVLVGVGNDHAVIDAEEGAQILGEKTCFNNSMLGGLSDNGLEVGGGSVASVVEGERVEAFGSLGIGLENGERLNRECEDPIVNKEGGLGEDWLGVRVWSERAAEDILFMGLDPVLPNAIEGNPDVFDKSVSVVEDTESEGSGVEGFGITRKCKKWRWVKNIEEEELLQKKNRKGKKGKKNFNKCVNIYSSVSEGNRVANQSITDGDFQRRAKVINRKDDDEVNSVNVEEVWNLGKKLGLAAVEGDEIVLRKLRDRIRVVKRTAT
ncbi:hypothetical protein REPUB_Repub15cG0122200 [Reevesia pubescens]